MDMLQDFVKGIVSAVNSINGPGLGALAMILALMVVWKK